MQRLELPYPPLPPRTPNSSLPFLSSPPRASYPLLPPPATPSDLRSPVKPLPSTPLPPCCAATFCLLSPALVSPNTL
ncbi:hypothetical protein E2C01_039079 [Portunus trituberculatus]|uniref:Uncharacterized protein n=1 Tax=Portunus trituberculatus TaxID=210409 RepID=A0A5B7FDU7_PORTR|nr:hypothetical protein [Portunus trituberculatus]